MDHLLIITIGKTEFPSHTKDWRKFECNNKAIALNIQYVLYNTKEIRQAYISEHTDERNNQINMLMITDGTSNWHYCAIKNIWIIKRNSIK